MRARIAIAAIVLASFGLTGAASANYHPEFGGRVPQQGSVTLPVKSCPTSHLRVRSHVPLRIVRVGTIRLLVNTHTFSAGFQTACNVFTK